MARIKERVLNLNSTTKLAWLVTVLALFAGSGATCQRPLFNNPFVAAGPAAPQVLPEGPSREQIIAAVNQNAARVRSLSATGVTISISDAVGMPSLTGNIAAERPGRFRLTAGTGLSGQEIDLGSNDELFWIWIKRNEPPAVYFCQHEQFANSAIRQMLPVEPSWLLSALGMGEIDPATVFDGPLPRADGTVEIRSWLPSASGTLSRVTVIDARRAWVVEQYVYDPTGSTLLASAVAESHRYYPVEQVSLPDRVSIRLPASNIAMKIDLGTVAINQLPGDPRQLWALPTFTGYPQYDLGGATPGTPLPTRPVARQNFTYEPPPAAVVPASYPAAQPLSQPAPYPPPYQPPASGQQPTGGYFVR